MKWTISRKLYAAFGALITFTIVLGAVAAISLSRITDQIRVSAASTHKLELAGNIASLTSEIFSVERAMVIRTLLKDHAAIEDYKKLSIDDAAKRQAVTREFLGITTSAQSRALLQEMYDSYPDFVNMQTELYQLAIKGDGAGAARLQVGPLLQIQKTAAAHAESLKEVARDQVLELETADLAVANASMWVVGVLIALSLAVCAVVIYIVRTINQALQQTIVQLGDGAGQITSAVGLVSSSSRSLAQGASEHAASLEETSASSQQINAMARRNSDNALQMARVVAASKTEFANTNDELGDMMRAMNDINESSGQIAKIIKISDDIAFQTNILALNAAVEAARAGDVGMGFAVVADEVRNLAQRSAQAAKDVTTLIQESASRSEAGKKKLGVVAASITKLAGEFGSLGSLVDEVSLGSREQSVAIEQIGKALMEMETVSQSTAASAKESASAAEVLNTQSESMKELTERLNSMVGSQVETHPSLLKTRRPVPTGAPARLEPTLTRFARGVENNFTRKWQPDYSMEPALADSGFISF